MIQQHDATSMHWDFRLEVEDTFKSWAVPKGPSTDPREKRLAMAVDDHSLSWGSYEGVIGEGQYGAGPVIVWDRGTYRNLREEPMASALSAGHASFWLEGEKLRGGWSLLHTDRRRWLLVKRRDEHADSGDLVSERPESVVSGRSIDQLGQDQGGYRHDMPPPGAKKGTKRARQYEHVKESQKDQGKSEGRAEEIAARTLNKERARSGESRVGSKTSTDDLSSGRRGGQRSGTNKQRGRTRDQLYNEAKNLNIDGRSSMNKQQLQRAVEAKKS
ncbi:MAG: DNA polymerase ligase N-terminal domain-containing protein [Thermoleophilaceae bacterium]